MYRNHYSKTEPVNINRRLKSAIQESLLTLQSATTAYMNSIDRRNEKCSDEHLCHPSIDHGARERRRFGRSSITGGMNFSLNTKPPTGKRMGRSAPRPSRSLKNSTGAVISLRDLPAFTARTAVMRNCSPLLAKHVATALAATNEK